MTDLIAQLRNDRYDEVDVSEPAARDPIHEALERQQRRWFNLGSQHAESLILAAMQRERMRLALRELADCQPMDLRLKHAMTAADYPSAHELDGAP